MNLQDLMWAYLELCVTLTRYAAAGIPFAHGL